MAKEYAISENYGRRILLFIVCDRCGKKLRPGPHVRDSGWIREGLDDGPGSPKCIKEYCDACAASRG